MVSGFKYEEHEKMWMRVEEQCQLQEVLRGLKLKCAARIAESPQAQDCYKLVRGIKIKLVARVSERHQDYVCSKSCLKASS